MFAVKIKAESTKQFLFFGSGGKLTRLRLHAILFKTQEKAQELADEIKELYPTDTVKVVQM